MEVDLVRYGLKEPYFDLKKGDGELGWCICFKPYLDINKEGFE